MICTDLFSTHGRLHAAFGEGACGAPGGANVYKLLVVEDERAVADSIADFLRVSGYDVAVAYDGPSGVERFNETKPDLVILDLELPQMHGLDVLRAIRQHADVPVIILTGADDLTTRGAAEELGVQEFLTKPISMSELVARMNGLLPQPGGEELAPDAAVSATAPTEAGPAPQVAAPDETLARIGALSRQVDEASQRILEAVAQLGVKLDVLLQRAAGAVADAESPQVEELEREVKRLREELANKTLLLSSTRRELERELAEVRQLLAQRESAIDRLEREVQDLKAERDALQAELDERSGPWWRRIGSRTVPRPEQE